MITNKTALIAGLVTVGMVGGLASEAISTGLDTWKSGKGGTQPDSGKVGIAFYSNSSFQITSPRGISIIIDPWRNDPSGAWGLWYRMDFPKIDVDIGMSTHAHFDHDAIDKVDANMLLDRMAGSFTLGDVSITGIADIWDQIGEVDMVFLPVDGSKHILDYEQADAVFKKTGAKVAIPHHYLVPDTTFVTSTLQDASEWVETHEHTILNSASIEVTAAEIGEKSGHVMYFGSHNKVTN